MSDAIRRCFFCGYDIQGLAGNARCPECGRPAIDERDVLDHSAIKWRRGQWVAAVLFMSIFAVLAAICAGVLR